MKLSELIHGEKCAEVRYCRGIIRDKSYVPLAMTEAVYYDFSKNQLCVESVIFVIIVIFFPSALIKLIFIIFVFSVPILRFFEILRYYDFPRTAKSVMCNSCKFQAASELESESLGT